VRWASAASALLFAVLSVAATKADERADEIVAAAQLCGADVSDQQIAAGLQSARWRNVTPSLGGQSMAAITGATQYRRGNDEALISGRDSMAGQNCQFDFRKVKPEVEAAVVIRLDQILGPHTLGADGMMNWERGSDGYGLKRRSGDLLTLIWVPMAQQEG
jgi:hypothetical protein